MKSRTIIPALLVCFGLALSGCETYNKVIGRHAPFGTENLIDRESFQKIDLAAVLTGGETRLLEPDGSDVNRQNLEKAFKQFNEKIGTTATKDERKWLRNRVQERILAASNQACAEFKRELKALDARVNFVLGSLTTAVAGAGAIFSGGTSQALSGVASIFSGIRAEFNEDYFQMLTIQVITDGLGKKRQEIYTKILDNRKVDLTIYPVERAIADAIRYHDNCSLVAGLEQAALSLERAANPGMEQLIKFKKMEKVLREIDDKKDKPAGGDGGGNQGGSANSQPESSATPSERPPVEVAPPLP